MRQHVTLYLVSLVSSSATVCAMGWPSLHAHALLIAAVLSLLAPGVVLAWWAWARSADQRAAWHEQRALRLRESQSMISGLWPLAWILWLALGLIEWAHILRADGLGS